VRCILDNTSRAVLGIQFGYARQVGFQRQCGGATPGTTTITQNLALNTSGGTPDTQTTTFITGVEVMRYRSGRLPSRGRIPAIRFYPFDSTTQQPAGPVVCGNAADEAAGLLVPAGRILRSSNPQTYLSSFIARCSPRTLVNDPPDATFFVTALYGLCWAPRGAGKWTASLR